MGKPQSEDEGTKGQGQMQAALQLAAVIYVCSFVISSFPGRCPASSIRWVFGEGKEGVENTLSGLQTLRRDFSLQVYS